MSGSLMKRHFKIVCFKFVEFDCHSGHISPLSLYAGVHLLSPLLISNFYISNNQNISLLTYVCFCPIQLGLNCNCPLSIQTHVAAGDQLVHSAFLQSLASLTVGLSLEKHLCRFPRPPHHTCPDIHACPSEWSWLATYATTVRSAEAIASGTAFPESFIVSEFQDAEDTEIIKALVSSDKPLCPIVCLGNSWTCFRNLNVDIY